ncbi:probable E3 ubiquitin-protein ligase HIP1 [Punica granatum]|uniref:RING-type E3 ubiquitin transferase n=1 Tax=Punica granatum TaxID=22663 RepID=A0A6P8CK03_PUNGR|nr:probable E3 ubiquitin-protein ligase HIP1 [Punica granatum]
MALEESFGNVSTELTETIISLHVTRRKFQPPMSVVSSEESEKELCCICRDEYDEGLDIGRLVCGHEYHFCCIKQWLFHKNDCPICKRTAIKL